MTRAEGGSMSVKGREAAALEQRCWVRLTRLCNNRCAFCLDSDSHDGSRLAEKEVNARIIDGRREGATRLILSGGEPTLHPGFLRFVSLGKKLGYRRVQTITNGRLFSYPAFLRKALNAGLGEITFSIHGHDPAVHDSLVGVPEAFEETMAGLRGALTDGRPIVNVDVCLNKMNIQGLPMLLDRCIEMGVREFDLLHIIPFGRAYEEERERLFYDVDEAMSSIEYALELSRRDDLHIWFNRFPPAHLEGYEHLIQDPHKLEDEVRGRKLEIERWLATARPISCREPSRCKLCYLEDLCRHLEEIAEALSGETVDVLRIEVGPDGVVPGFSRSAKKALTMWLRAPDAAAAAKALRSFDGERLILELDSTDGLEALIESGSRLRERLTRVYVSSPEDIDRLVGLDLFPEIVARLTKDVAAHLLERYPEAPAGLAVAGGQHALMSESARLDPDLSDFFSRWDRSAPVEGVPECISGRAPRSVPRAIDASALSPNGGIDVIGLTRSYVLDSFRTKSHRCRACPRYDTCEGAHISWVRAHGYGELDPAKPSRT